MTRTKGESNVVNDRRTVRDPGLDATHFEGKSEAAILDGYLRQVRAWRRTQQPRGFRQADLEVLVAILGTDPDTIEGKLRALTGCSSKTAAVFRKAFLVALVCSSVLLVEQGVAAAASDPAGAPQATYGAASSTDAPPTSAAVVPVATTPTAEVALACKTTGSAPVAHKTDPAPPSVSGGTTVTFTIRPIVDVHLDSAGHPDAVRTNTGNSPDCASTWSATTSLSGPTAPTSDLAMVNRVIASAAADAMLPAAGDWTPGTWYGLNKR